MAESKELVRLIRYEFGFSNLLTTLNDFELVLYKIPKSIQKYIDLCEKELQRIYPEASIEIIGYEDISIDDPEKDISVNESKAYVESLIDFEQLPDPDEADIVADVCERIFSQQLDDWAISKDFKPIVQVKNHAKIPITVIRWLCSHELIEATIKVTESWLVLFDDISKIKSLVTFIHNPMQLNAFLDGNTVVACYLEELGDVLLTNIPENIKFLMATKEGFDKRLFTADNALCRFYRVGDKVELEVEHFIDTTGWSGWKWTYLDWSSALKKQADSKGIGCEIRLVERNTKQEATGISFFMPANLMPETTIQMLIQEGLDRLSSIVDDANLNLNGGPVWDDEADKIYQKDEIRFHKEVLRPLLDKMYEGRVFYTHSNRGEHGRDFVFAETTKFQDTMYYALQAKAGNVSGGANDDIDTLVIQIKRAFTMPLRLEVKKQEDYISAMIIATSGDFTLDAKDVMRQEIPKRLVGSVYFWNKEKILALIAEQWK